MVAGFKPNQIVFACTPDQKIINAMRILYGIEGIQFDKWESHTTENQEKAIKILLKKKLIKSWDKIVIIADKKRNGKTDPLIRVTVVD